MQALLTVPFALFWLGFSAVAAATGVPKAVIQPGYQPLDEQAEKGLWMELEEYEAAIRRSALLIRDESINRYVSDVACRVTGDYCADLRIYVIRNPSFNASMTANGVLQVWSGLLVRVSSEDELAAVLGHELAHYTQLHSLQRLRRIRSGMTSSSIIDLFLGVPLAQMATVAGIMSFSRDQETEADLLGVNFMAQSGYDPAAAADVWQMIVEEEKNAAAKRQPPGLFSSTHPAAEDRIENLRDFVGEHFSEPGPSRRKSDRHVRILNDYYPLLMEDQIDTNRFGRTEAMLKRHREIGVDEGLIEFFHGEMYRQRNAKGDLALAQQAYERSLQSDNPVVDANRNLGYINLKQGDPEAAAVHFRRYLELAPDADDRAMIEFYLEE